MRLANLKVYFLLSWHRRSTRAPERLVTLIGEGLARFHNDLESWGESSFMSLFGGWNRSFDTVLPSTSCGANPMTRARRTNASEDALGLGFEVQDLGGHSFGFRA